MNATRLALAGLLVLSCGGHVTAAPAGDVQSGPDAGSTGNDASTSPADANAQCPDPDLVRLYDPCSGTATCPSSSSPIRDCSGKITGYDSCSCSEGAWQCPQPGQGHCVCVVEGSPCGDSLFCPAPTPGPCGGTQLLRCIDGIYKRDVEQCDPQKPLPSTCVTKSACGDYACRCGPSNTVVCDPPPPCVVDAG